MPLQPFYSPVILYFRPQGFFGPGVERTRVSACATTEEQLGGYREATASQQGAPALPRRRATEVNLYIAASPLCARLCARAQRASQLAEMPYGLDTPVLTVDAKVIHKVDTSNPANLFSMWTGECFPPPKKETSSGRRRR